MLPQGTQERGIPCELMRSPCSMAMVWREVPSSVSSLCKEASMAEHSEYYTYYRERLLGLCPTLSEGLIEELSLGGQVVHFAIR